jgi:hypothetical protein
MAQGETSRDQLVGLNVGLDVAVAIDAKSRALRQGTRRYPITDPLPPLIASANTATLAVILWDIIQTWTAPVGIIYFLIYRR